MWSLRLSQKTVDALKCDLKIQPVKSRSFCTVVKDRQALSQQKKKPCFFPTWAFLRVSRICHHRSWRPLFLNPPAKYVHLHPSFRHITIFPCFWKSFLWELSVAVDGNGYPVCFHYQMELADFAILCWGNLRIGSREATKSLCLPRVEGLGSPAALISVELSVNST